MSSFTALQIDTNAIRGEAGTGFEEAGDLGEFECGNCKYFRVERGNGCFQKDMKEKSKRLRHPNGDVYAGPEDCCEYVWRVGRKDEDEDSRSYR